MVVGLTPVVGGRTEVVVGGLTEGAGPDLEGPEVGRVLVRVGGAVCLVVGAVVGLEAGFVVGAVGFC